MINACEALKQHNTDDMAPAVFRPKFTIKEDQ